ncbi:TorF family putative porin [Marinilabilia salmonicolor]|jgi:hypothetical protein|uniref:Uncharacterized protein Gcw-chp n=1 Tax=Marinilabilia salmonicolor TaxID=989 RepID=A0A2T0XPL1_9BACT|nr:TorF family putative porin [Marinilabilia salmonicolor]PRZ00879.1 uncharacterized protein Gcw-chp [Marinilabilia salmonicolor]RCW30385.1 uncharacterized protein Gcw-chp [Marinilabilia salmonicolor]
MRNFGKLFLVLTITGLFASGFNARSQVEVSVGADLMSRYVWRGTDFGGSPSIQPYMEMSAGDFVLGAWGAYTTNLPGAQEADLYAGYSFGDVFSLTVTDYYFPMDDMSDDYFDFDSNHSMEVSGTLSLDKFSLLAGKFFAGADDKSLYLEAGYDFGLVNAFIGAGDEVYTTDGDFGIVNVGIGASKEIKLTEYFSLPLSGSVILNPESESLFMVVGVSF